MPAKLSLRLSLLDNSLSTEFSKHYVLCLETGLTGISLAVYNKQKNIFLAIEHFDFGKAASETEIIHLLDKLFEESKCLKLSFSETILVINNNKSTLVPLALFDESERESYLKFNQSVSETESAQYHLLKNVQVANIYAVPEILLDFLDKKWPGAKKLQYSGCAIEILGNQFKNRTDNKTLYTNLRDDSFDLVYFKDSKLFFYNNFKFKTKEDFLYFLLLTMELLGLSPEDTKLELTGKISEGSGMFVILHEYVRYCNFIERNNFYNYSELLDDEICRQFYVLMNAVQCV